MVKVKIFGVLRSTTGLSEHNTSAKTVNGIFEEISEMARDTAAHTVSSLKIR